MQPVPRIFVSATSRDLRTARGLVSEGLRRMECLPIVQDDFPPDYKSVRDMLRTKISTCNAVVHLAGFYYGAEPQPVLPGPDRRSFTQMEYEIAMELKLPCYVFLCGKNFPFDPHDPEPEEKQQLQLAHRDRLLQRDELFYEFASPEELANRTRELQLSVENLRKELARERGRRRLAMIAAVAALVIASGGGYFLLGRQQKQAAVISAQSDQLAQLQAKLEQFSAIVDKVNLAQEQARKQGLADASGTRRMALQTVAAETGKTVEQVEQTIDATATAARELATAARTQASTDPARLVESRQIEADALLKLAAAHEAAGRYGEALVAYTEALALLDVTKDPNRWAAAVDKAGWMEYQIEKFADARTRYEKAFEIVSNTPGLGLASEPALRIASGLRRTLVAMKDLDAAEKMDRKILAATEGKPGTETPETIRIVAGLADSLLWKKHYFSPLNSTSAEKTAADAALAEGEVLIRRAIATSERVNGADSSDHAALLATLGRALTLKKDFAGSIAAYERVQELRAKIFGADSDLTISGLPMLAQAYSGAGDTDKTEQLLRRVIAWREKNLGPQHPETVDALNLLAIELREAKKDDEAAIVLERALPASRAAFGPEHSTTISVEYSLGMILKDRKEFAAAEKLLRHRYEWMRKTKGTDSTSTALAASLLGDVLLDLGGASNRAESAELFQTAHQIQLAKLGADHPLTKGSAKLIEIAKSSPASEKAPAPEKAPPSLAEFADLRKSINDKLKSEDWKEFSQKLPEASKERDLSVTGWVEGKTLRKLMKVDAKDDNNGTFTFYYWSQGWLTSVLRIREGSAVPIKDVAKATDTYNFWNGKLVGWKRTQDDNEKIEDSAENDFAELGKRITAEAEEAAAPILKAIGAE